MMLHVAAVTVPAVLVHGNDCDSTPAPSEKTTTPAA